MLFCTFLCNVKLAWSSGTAAPVLISLASALSFHWLWPAFDKKSRMQTSYWVMTAVNACNLLGFKRWIGENKNWNAGIQDIQLLNKAIHKLHRQIMTVKLMLNISGLVSFAHSQAFLDITDCERACFSPWACVLCLILSIVWLWAGLHLHNKVNSTASWEGTWWHYY